MTTFLTDENGDIIITVSGQLVELEGKDESIERLKNVFMTQRNSEPFIQDYGFDFMSLHGTTGKYQEVMLRTYVLEALDPVSLYKIDHIQHLEVTVDNGVGNVNVELLYNGDLVSENFSLGEL